MWKERAQLPLRSAPARRASGSPRAAADTGARHDRGYSVGRLVRESAPAGARAGPGPAQRRPARLRQRGPRCFTGLWPGMVTSSRREVTFFRWRIAFPSVGTKQDAQITASMSRNELPQQLLKAVYEAVAGAELRLVEVRKRSASPTTVSPGLRGLACWGSPRTGLLPGGDLNRSSSQGRPWNPTSPLGPRQRPWSKYPARPLPVQGGLAAPFTQEVKGPSISTGPDSGPGTPAPPARGRGGDRHPGQVIHWS